MASSGICRILGKATISLHFPREAVLSYYVKFYRITKRHTSVRAAAASSLERSSIAWSRISKQCRSFRMAVYYPVDGVTSEGRPWPSRWMYSA